MTIKSRILSAALLVGAVVVGSQAQAATFGQKSCELKSNTICTSMVKSGEIKVQQKNRCISKTNTELQCASKK